MFGLKPKSAKKRADDLFAAGLKKSEAGDEPGALAHYLALASACKAEEVEFEDWQAQVRNLCRACSEGRAHEQHDHSAQSDEWQTKRRVGFAAKDSAKVNALLDRWGKAGSGRRIVSLELVRGE